jgi:hypothetical protein
VIAGREVCAMIEVKRQQAMLIAGIGVLVLGAGSIFLFAGGSDPPKSDDTVVERPDKIVRDVAAKPPTIKRTPRDKKPEPPDRIKRGPRKPREEQDKRKRSPRGPKPERKRTLPKKA